MNLKLRIRCVFKFSSKYHIPYDKSYVLKYVIMSCDSMKIYYKPFNGFSNCYYTLDFHLFRWSIFFPKKKFSSQGYWAIEKGHTFIFH